MADGDDDNADPEYIQILQNYGQYAQHGALDLGDQERAEEEEEEEEEEEDDREDEEYVPSVELHGVSRNGPIIYEALEYGLEEEGYKRRRTEGGEACSSTSQDNEWSRSEIDGLFCPICMEAWTVDGGHHICCLPCGHIYGMSCINKWLKQRKNSGKCPQCNRKCTLKDVTKLFASRVVAVDEESQKRIRSLEARCASLEKKGADWCKKEAEWKKREAELHVKVCQLSEGKIYLEKLLKDMQSRPSGVVKAAGNCQGRSVFGQNFGSALCGQESSSSFILQKEFWLDGARLIDVDASSQILLIVRRRSEMGATSVLTKMSLMPPHEKEDIFLPSNMKVIKDLCISPSNGSLVLFASLGQKLSVLSLESNNIILAYDLPAAAWSCSWDLQNSNYIYAGLQNGSLLVFDVRQTVRPVNSLKGLTCNPVHTIHSLLHSSTLLPGVRSVLSASSIGLCHWNFGGAEEGPFLVPQTDNQGVCISLAYSPSSDDIVASYRPKVEMSNMAFTQPALTPSQVIGQGVQGSHIFYNRVGSNCFQKLGSASANVNDIRLPKRSAIIDVESQNRLFASGDEVTCELILQELPSFAAFQHLKIQKQHICDVKYTHALGQGLLSCLEEDRLQIFCMKLS
ncbi:E3 ubiquitin-protein ligase RFWD3 [Juglans regia]|uniref:RING-type E3 ubiquitin transferase n=2 Tax=Juglans regia TaxID=51240 RepID=A0A2I4GFH5_JUGRE|nr:E3 ubiquitin-protein ligase RFWD3 [Juglans regia]